MLLKVFKIQNFSQSAACNFPKTQKVGNKMSPLIIWISVIQHLVLVPGASFHISGTDMDTDT